MSQNFSLFTRMNKDLPLSILHELTYEIQVSEVMSPQISTLPSTISMRDVKNVMRSQRISGIPIVSAEQQKLLGLVSVEDLIRALEQNKLDAAVTEFMATNLITALDEEPVVEALKRLERTGFGRLVVVDKKGNLAGILTKGDIMAGLLRALEKTYHRVEQLQQDEQSHHFFAALNSDETSLTLRYRVRAGDFIKGGQASSNIKKALQHIGATPQLARRVAIATYEIEINLIIHTDDGGYIVAEVRPAQIKVVAHDDGPGIADVSLARQPGYSTASSKAREMGFGAGMGLVNAERCADELHVWSALTVGTRVEMIFNVAVP
ncbi:MAG TPA: CBS domain-containing protein [Thermoflexia bacterium]|nr:CBS domain-containing protein [Thermoflexia bacterium]